MNLFAIDTSTENISFALLWQDKLIINYNKRLKFSSSKIILYIDRYIKKYKLNLKNIDALVIGNGPGSFMGLRISHSIIKAFSLIWQKPIIAIGSLFSVAYNFKDKEKVAVIASAKKNLIYAATFKKKKSIFAQEGKEKLTTLEEFIKEKKDYFFVTYDEDIRREVLKHYLCVDFCKKNIWPSAANLLEIAKDYFRKNKFTPLQKLEPLYLHPKTSQVHIKPDKKGD
ncbi:MAG: tRNA (adenosine(37)-N6)-threonylcarbamoyltransferase complex dimerization subunit type 1 TsaB [Candidatus Omnitrophica bacterium]|nr:tRNA (adenosine(37)-N6)-threonylcarbamoyltransferase complex dimerization subunit type 1 TsaB [Candidatus Omnitrophota bacterium]